MRKSTQRKLWGRAQLVVELRSTIQELDAAMKAAELLGIHGHQITAHLKLALANCVVAGQAMDIYKVERKRIHTALEKERVNLTKIMDLARSIPVTAEEITLSKDKRKKQEGGKGHG